MATWPGCALTGGTITAAAEAGAHLVLAGEAALVALAVLGDVERVGLLELLAVLDDDVVAAGGGARGLGGVVGVAASAVPVAGDGLRVESHLDVEELPDAVQNVPESERQA